MEMNSSSIEILKNIQAKDLEKIGLLIYSLSQSHINTSISIEKFIEEYSEYIKTSKSQAYHKSVKIAFVHLTRFFDKQRLISAIEFKEIENFLLYLQSNVKKGYIVYYRNLKAAFNKAIDWNYLQKNHFIKVKLPKRQKTYPAYINSEQLLEICKVIKNTAVRDAVISGFYTGMRLSELVNLKWRNIDLKKKIITVGDEEFSTKGRNQRRIPICDIVLEIFSQAIIQNESDKIIQIGSRYVFCKKNGKPFSTDYVSKVFKRACVNLGLDFRIHFHSLRHSFASFLSQKGVSILILKELLGHSSYTTTEIYSHLNVDSLESAINKLNEINKKHDSSDTFQS